MGGVVFPPCSLASGKTMVGEMVVMVTSFKRTMPAGPSFQDCCIQRPWPHGSPLSTQASAGDSDTQASLAQPLVGSLLRSPGSWCAQVLFVSPRVYFPSSVEVLLPQSSGTKTARRNISYLRYADGTTLMAESEEEIKSLLMKVKKESEKAGLKINIQKTKIMTSNPITSGQIDGKKMETVTDFIFLVSKSHCGQWLQSWN